MSFSPVTGPIRLSQRGLVMQLRRVLKDFTDPRTGKNTRYRVEDAALSAFSVFFMQCPSFLAMAATMPILGSVWSISGWYPTTPEKRMT
jgi:hypothetical protein